MSFKDRLSFESLDDYGADKEKIWFEVLDIGVEGYNLLLLVHALVEYLTTQGRGIPLKLIEKFDNDNPDSPEPGDEEDAPYRNEHCLATGIERLLCSYLNIPWRVYEKTLDKALEVYHHD